MSLEIAGLRIMFSIILNCTAQHDRHRIVKNRLAENQRIQIDVDILLAKDRENCQRISRRNQSSEIERIKEREAGSEA